MAPGTSSGGRRERVTSRCQRASTRTTPRNDAAFRRKTQPAPRAATRSPPSAGPRARATLTEMPPSATAAASSSRGTRSGVVACQAGALSALPRPMQKVSESSNHGPVRRSTVETPSAVAATSIHTCVARSSRRRSTMSASAPAGSARRKNGRLVAVCMSDTMSGEGASPVMSQAALVSCIHVPTFETHEASQSARKTGWARGLQADEGRIRACYAARAWPVKYTGPEAWRELPRPTRRENIGDGTRSAQMAIIHERAALRRGRLLRGERRPRLQRRVAVPDMLSRRPKVLVIDVGGTHVKVLASGHREPREIPSGPSMDASGMVAGGQAAHRRLALRRGVDRLSGGGRPRATGGRALQPGPRLGELRLPEGLRPPRADHQRCGHAGAGQLPARPDAVPGPRHRPRIGDDHRRPPRADGARAPAVPEGPHLRGLRGTARPRAPRQEALAPPRGGRRGAPEGEALEAAPS